MEKQRKSRSWIFHALLFTAIFLVTFIFVSYLFRPVSKSRINISGLYAEPENSLDVIAIGGSSTHIFYMPYEAWREFGIVSYDYSTDSMSPSVMKNLIIEAEKTQSPRLYLLDMRAFENRERRPDFYCVAYLRNITDSMKYSLNRLDMIRYAFKNEQPQSLSEPAVYLDLMYYHSLWQTMNYYYGFVYVGNDVPEAGKGFWLSGTYASQDTRDFSDVTERKSLSPENEAVLRDLLEYCRDNDIPALFTLNPFQMKDADTKAYYNYIGDVIHEYGYEFLDTNEYYDEMGIDFTKDFYNNNHLNVFGAGKYTHFLAKYIRDNYAMPDHRGEPAYSAWDEGYPAWAEDKSEYEEYISELMAEGS